MEARLAAFVVGVVVAWAALGFAAGRGGRYIPDSAAGPGLLRYARPVALGCLLGVVGLSAVVATMVAAVVLPVGFDGVGDPEVRLVCQGVVATLAANVAVIGWAAGHGADLAVRRAPLGAWGAAGLIAVGALAVSALWSLLLSTVGQSPDQAAYAFLGDGSEPVAVALVGAFVVLGAPATEELVWRGLLLGAAVRVVGARGAVFGTAVAFGLAHGSDPLAVPAILFLGLALGGLRVWSGSVLPGILAHALYNGAALLVLRS